jgi:hypothetical protein
MKSLTIPHWNGKVLSCDRRFDIPEVRNYLQTNPAATKYFKKSRSLNNLGTVFRIIGGFAVGWELGNLISGREIDWTIMAPGLVLTGFTIAFDIGSKKAAEQAVYLYNKPYGWSFV